MIAPGAGYSPSHPLLEFCRQSLVNHGWSVQQIWWDQPDDLSDADASAAWVCDQVRATLATLDGAQRVLLVGKSLGSLSAPVAAQYGLDAIWLTPLFRYEPGIAAIFDNAAAGARQLLVGGLADPDWDPVRARALRWTSSTSTTSPTSSTCPATPSGRLRSTSRSPPRSRRSSTAWTPTQTVSTTSATCWTGSSRAWLTPATGAGLGLALDELRARGFTAVVSLDEAGLSPEVVREHGLVPRHIPVPDFHPPTPGQADAFVAFVNEQLDQGGQVVVHCQAGIGRTGTMLAAYLIATGMSAEEAIATARRRNPHSVESDDQRTFLEDYANGRADAWRSRARSP